MIETTYHLEGLATAQHFEHWRQQLRGNYEVKSEHTADFRAHERVLRLGPVQLARRSLPRMELRRARRASSDDEPSVYEITLPRRGTAYGVWPERTIADEAGGLYVQDMETLQALAFEPPRGARTFQLTSLRIPKSLLTLPADKVARLFDQRVPVDRGGGALLAGFIDRLEADSGSFGPGDGPALGTVLVDLAAALFGKLLGAEAALAPETRTVELTHRIRAFIQQHLSDHELSPRIVAEAHHISVGYLHRLFRREGTTVSAFIREQRLEHARRALADGALREFPIHSIAARWGFPTAADFSRAFRAAYGTAPRDYRHQALAIRRR